MYSLALNPLSYRGDPTIRGLAKLPTMFTANDVSQGAAGDTNMASTLAAAARTAAAGDYTLSVSLNTVSGEGQGPTATPPIAPPDPTGTPSGTNCSPYSLDPRCWFTTGGPTGVAGAANAIGIGDGITGILNRSLFGLLALVLVGFGLYIFAKD